MGEGRLSLGPLQTTECRFFWPQDLITPVQQTLLAVLLQGQERVRLVGRGSLQPEGISRRRLGCVPWVQILGLHKEGEGEAAGTGPGRYQR